MKPKLRQGMKFRSKETVKARGVTAARRATKRALASETARDLVSVFPDDPKVVEFAIVALGDRHAKLTDGLTTASFLSVQAGRHCPDIESQAALARVFGGEG